MGMSASQARFLSLTARKNNVEFHGQQINQQRTTLSNESANYYSELADMAVPIPPSIDDYTKISYTFNDGAVSNTLISLYPDRNSDTKNKYIVNYLEQWQDDYAIVPSSSSMVEVDNPNNPGRYSIGSQVLREAGVMPEYSQQDEYFKSLTEEQQEELLKNEQTLVKMAQDATGDDGNFYIRYIKNTTSGNYEPYLYAESELSQGQKYNNKNLASVPCYSLGSVTQTNEVYNKSAVVEKDSSGRYVSITIDQGIGIKTIHRDNSWEISKYYSENPAPKQQDYTKTIYTGVTRNNQSDIDAYWANTPEPVQESYKKDILIPIPYNNQSDIDAYFANNPEPVQDDYQMEGTIPVVKNNMSEINAYYANNPEPVQSDYSKTVTNYVTVDNQSEINAYKATHSEPLQADYTRVVTDTTLYTQLIAYGGSCYSKATDPLNPDTDCIIGLLAHVIDLDVTLSVGGGYADPDYQATTASYPKYFATTGTTSSDGVYFSPHSVKIEANDINLSHICHDNGTNGMQVISNALNYGYYLASEGVNATVMATGSSGDQHADFLLNLKTGFATEQQVLLSNYYQDLAGNAHRKTLKQKAIDLLYAAKAGLLPASSLTTAKIMEAFMYSLCTFELPDEQSYQQAHQQWVDSTTYREWTEEEKSTVPDVDAYNAAHQAWQNGVPAYLEWTENVSIGLVPDTQAYNAAHDAWLNGAPKYAEWTEYKPSTVNDVDAYNAAHDAWINGAPQYSEWTEDVPSTGPDEDAYNAALAEYKAGAPEYKKWDEYEEYPIGERTYKLTATTTTDEDAYNNAMNQYNYNKAVYDKKIEEINSKIKIIQQQDKNLELQLKQLDTEENAISTEIDAVKKVISKNVESSFKTFNA